MKVLLCLVVAFVTIADVYGALSISPIQNETVYGSIVKFCVHKGVRMLPKSTLKDYDDCAICKCKKKTGLTCATMNTAFSLSSPDDSKCENVRIGCVNTWVMKSNQKKKCPKPLIPKTISIVGK